VAGLGVLPWPKSGYLPAWSGSIQTFGVSQAREFIALRNDINPGPQAEEEEDDDFFTPRG